MRLPVPLPLPLPCAVSTPRIPPRLRYGRKRASGVSYFREGDEVMDGRRRFDRLLGILLLLRSGQAVPAADIGRRFGVSRRTVHRDMDALSALGIPVYAERGRGGGFRLLPGYFLPPIMFAEEEAISLVLGLISLGSLHAAPHGAALETAERKLLAALPERLGQHCHRRDRSSALSVSRTTSSIRSHRTPSPLRVARPTRGEPCARSCAPSSIGGASRWSTARRTVAWRTRLPLPPAASSGTRDPAGICRGAGDGAGSAGTLAGRSRHRHCAGGGDGRDAAVRRARVARPAVAGGGDDGLGGRDAAAHPHDRRPGRAPVPRLALPARAIRAVSRWRGDRDNGENTPRRTR